MAGKTEGVLKVPDFPDRLRRQAGPRCLCPGNGLSPGIHLGTMLTMMAALVN